MTHIVTTTITNSTGPALDMTGAGDTALVASSGALIGLNDWAGLQLDGANEQATIDGLAYSDTGDAVFVDGQGDFLWLNGQAQGGFGGVDLFGVSGNKLFIGAQGVAQGANHGAEIDQSSNVQVQNAGHVTGNIGIGIGESGGNVINNTGTISGTLEGISFGDETAIDTVENSGTISGSGEQGFLASAIDSFNETGGGGLDIVNGGLLTNAAPNAAGSFMATLLFDDRSNAITDTIDNTGQILGAGYSIQSYFDNLDIANSGTIHGGLWTSNGGVVQIDNSGVWQGGAGGAGLSFSAAGDRLNNTQTIDAFISMVAGGDVLTNSGSIAGFIDLFGASGGGDYLYNSGSMSDGGIASTGVGDTLINAATGSISGPVTLYGAGSSAQNSGTIDGNVDLLGGGIGNALKNSGSITGDITMTGSTSRLVNHGQIYGDLTLGSGETLANTGVIHGDVKLGSSDVIDDSRGKVTGAFTAAAKDTFQYRANFGNEMIDNFFAGAASNHDTIQFAASDFGSYAAVKGAMSQVGPDVVIRLDATDSISLVNQTLASLVAADFKFV